MKTRDEIRRLLEAKRKRALQRDILSRFERLVLANWPTLISSLKDKKK